MYLQHRGAAKTFKRIRSLVEKEYTRMPVVTVITLEIGRLLVATAAMKNQIRALPSHHTMAQLAA